MSALVLGKRSSSCFLEELKHHPAAGAATTPPPPLSASKRARFGPSSPRFSCPRSLGSSSPASAEEFSSLPTSDGAAGVRSSGGLGNKLTPFDHLRALFPDVDEQLLERALEASGNDPDSAIKSMDELRVGKTKGILQCAVSLPVADIGTIAQHLAADISDKSGVKSVYENPSVMNKLPEDGSEWVELLVREMLNAGDIVDARSRASRVLEVLERSIMDQAGAEVAQRFHKENMMLKEQVEGLLRDNNILKRAVAIQHERQKVFDERNQELEHLKRLVVQYQEQLRTLEINNYALSMHLRQAQQSSSIPGHFHPDVF